MSEFIRGHLYQEGDLIYLKSPKLPKDLELIIPSHYRFAFDSKLLNSEEYFFELVGVKEEGQFLVEATPTIVADLEDLEGHLKKEGEQLYIGKTKVRLGRTKLIHESSFDDQGLEFYLDQEVLSQGHFEDDIFIINALLQKNLITSRGDKFPPPPEFFKESPFDFVLKEMPKNEFSQRREGFRAVLHEDEGYSPSTGEGVLIISLSGRQGDDPSSSGGHFAIGMGEVLEDGRILGETFNFYFEGEKEVLAGNTDLVSYFGHLIQGQQNYRPSYTLYAYGVPPEDLLKVRNEYEQDLHRVRTEEGLKITPGYNCATTSNAHLMKIGIKGSHNNLLVSAGKLRKQIAKLNPLAWKAKGTNKEGLLGKARFISYILKTDLADFMPRPALESFIKNFSNPSRRKKMGIKRVDYVFLSQLPSTRQVGGMSYDSLRDASKIVSFSEERANRLKEVEKAKLVLDDPDSKAEEKEIAEKYLSEVPSWEEDQRIVKEVLETID